jgi:hypothetical protein
LIQTGFSQGCTIFRTTSSFQHRNLRTSGIGTAVAYRTCACVSSHWSVHEFCTVECNDSIAMPSGICLVAVRAAVTSIFASSSHVYDAEALQKSGLGHDRLLILNRRCDPHAEYSEVIYFTQSIQCHFQVTAIPSSYHTNTSRRLRSRYQRVAADLFTSLRAILSANPT